MFPYFQLWHHYLTYDGSDMCYDVFCPADLTRLKAADTTHHLPCKRLRKSTASLNLREKPSGKTQGIDMAPTQTTLLTTYCSIIILNASIRVPYGTAVHIKQKKKICYNKSYTCKGSTTFDFFLSSSCLSCCCIRLRRPLLHVLHVALLVGRLHSHDCVQRPKVVTHTCLQRPKVVSPKRLATPGNAPNIDAVMRLTRESF